jgi:hypothetical protein
MKQLILLAAVLTFAAGQSYIGRVDTIGGTTYDWWANTNVHRLLVNSPQHGIHAAWMYSASTSGTSFPDRDVRYNYYDHSIHAWTWIDDYMSSGVNVFDERAGYGVIDADSAGRASIVANTGSGLAIARDASPGTGIFEFSAPLPGYSGPDMSVGDDGTYHVIMSSVTYSVGYSRVRTWGSWDSVRPLPTTSFPSYGISAGKKTPSVCMAWVDDTSALYLLSDNRGDTWGSSVELDPPPAFGGDTVARFSLYGLSPFFDSQGRLHIAAAVYPEVHDTAYPNPAEIWHWCPANQPHWARIHHAGCAPEHLQASVGYNAMYADRPSMGEGRDGRLYVAWEQFDSSNVETTTSRLRAGVWASGSTNNGATWGDGLLLTERNTASHRFPCIIDRVLTGDLCDTVCVLYLKDSVAGFFVQGEGAATDNPVICQFVPTYIDGVADTQCIQSPSISKMTPTIVRGVMMLGAGDGRHDTGCRGELMDATGRKVMELHAGANVTRALAPGIYFVREEPYVVGLDRQAVRKVLVVR